VTEELTGKNCPACGIELLRKELVGQEIAECTHCNGIWVDRHSFEDLVECAAKNQGAEEIHTFSERRAKPLLVSKDGRKGFTYRKCPECGVMMHRKRFKRISDVVMDECAIHGVWLDVDELAAIARFVAEGGLARAEAHEAREKMAGAEHTVFVTTYETDSDSFPDLPEELFEDMDGDFDGQVEQEIVIEYEDGSVEHRRRTLRPGGSGLKSVIRSFLDEG
jgi:Zn-finger nucleic acid-binding protein